jgi:threonine/homoserine/homoserine lactone efflux protein
MRSDTLPGAKPSALGERPPVSPEQIAAFLTFSVVAAITPGPGNILLTATGAAVGIWRGIGCLFGISAGMASLMFAVALGLGSLILRYPLLLEIMKWAGGAFLLWLAWKIATAKVADQSEAPKPVGFLEAALLQWINPKAWVVTTGAVGTYFPADANGVFIQALALAGLFVAAALPSGLVWLGFGATMQRFLSTPRAARAFNIAMALLLAASVVLAFTGNASTR